MVEVIWTGPALAELDAIADTIALDKPSAASRFVRRVFSSVERLANFPESGSRVPELPKSVYRQLVVPPCRIFHRNDGRRVFIVFVMRGERQFKEEFLRESGG
jgi:toxin ParE1/3/4